MKNIIPIIILTLLLSSCKTNLNKHYKNENIPIETKTRIDELNVLIINSIKENKTKSIKSILSENLIKKIGISKIDSIFSHISPIVRNQKFKEKDSYYVVNTNSNISNTILSGSNKEIDYSLTYTALNEKMFISLFKTTNLEDNLLLTLIYGLDKKGTWKLNIFHVGQYETFDKNFPQYYNISKTELEKKHLINAASNLHAGKQVIKPAREILKYQIEKDFFELEKKVFNQINKEYRFPIIVKNMETNPEIFNLYPQRSDEGFSTMIRYKTAIDLKDIINLKKENLKLQKNIESIFKGITKNKYIFYRAYAEFPNEKGKNYNYYGFVQELK